MPERKKTLSWRTKVTTLASWNSLKFPIRDCIRRLIRTTTRQAHSQDEEKGDGRKIRRDRDMQGEDEGDRSGGLARTSQAESMGEAAIVARRRRTRWQGTEGGKESFLLLYCIWLAALGAFLGSSSCMSTRSWDSEED
jgi:hypothetical protein